LRSSRDPAEDAAMLMIAAASSATGLRVVFGIVLLLLLAAGVYILRHRREFFGYHGAEGDTYASANLRMWLVILVWIHAVLLTTLMIFEV
jgi:hypothetical protein